MERDHCWRDRRGRACIRPSHLCRGIGLSLSSAAPTWRDTSWALVLISGLYLLLMALASYGFGAYLAALVIYQQLSGRSPIGLPSTFERIFVPPSRAVLLQEAAAEANARPGR